MVVWAALLFFQHTTLLDLPVIDKNPHTSAADIAVGKKLYAGRCAGCHGPAGDGGKGTNLATPALPRAQTDLALYRIIRYGLPETEMPGHNLTAREIWQISAYVRGLGRSEGEMVTGNSERGATLLRSTGCLQCHILNGEGGLLGPSLTDIGIRRSPSYLQNKLLNPGGDVASMVNQVQLMAPGGRKITGIRMNEDTWSIQLRDLNGALHSFWKKDVTDLRVETLTLMPSYRARLNKQEIDDLVAYLARVGPRL